MGITRGTERGRGRGEKREVEFGSLFYQHTNQQEASQDLHLSILTLVLAHYFFFPPMSLLDRILLKTLFFNVYGFSPLQVCSAWRGIRSLGTAVTQDCEWPCGYWELNLCPLEKQPELLTTEPYLQSLRFIFTLYVRVFFSVGMSVHHVCAMPSVARRGCQMLWNRSFRSLLVPWGCWDPNLGLPKSRRCSSSPVRYFSSPNLVFLKKNSESSLCLRIFVGQPSSTSLDVQFISPVSVGLWGCHMLFVDNI